MDNREANVLWLYMAEVWPHYRVPETVEEIELREQVWLDLLGDLEPNLVRAVIANMATREFAPTPGQIREAADEAVARMRHEHAPDPDEAWREVRMAVGVHIFRDGEEAGPEWSHPAIADAVRAMGWRDFCNSPTDDSAIWRAHFLRFYGTAVTRHRRQVGIGIAPIVAELAEAFAVPELAP
jgi:hypothetical protein